MPTTRHGAITTHDDHSWVEDTAITTLTWIGGEAGHEVGDYLVQLDRDAIRKKGWAFPSKPAWRGDTRTACQRVRDGKTSLIRHVVTYAISQAATRYAIYRTAGIRPPTHGVVLACAAEAALHGVIDHGKALDRFIHATGKDRFAKLGEPRRLLPLVETPDGQVHEVVLVEPGPGGGPARDDDSNLIVVDTPHDNPTFSTGRWAIDQALHRSVQFLAGAAITVWATRRARRKGATR